MKKVKGLFLDTETYMACNFDFKGVHGKALPSLRDICIENEITLYCSEIITNEIKRHLIERSVEQSNKLRKALDALEIVTNSSRGELLTKLKDMKIGRHLINQMEEFFSDCSYEEIPYDGVDSKQIFEKYFSEIAPFSIKKKSEFPDAFVLQSIFNFVCENDIYMLVVSNDIDWRNSCKDREQIIFMDTISEALNYLNEVYNSEEETAQKYFDMVENELYSLLTAEIENSTFCADNGIETEDIEIYNVSISQIDDLCLLSISDEEVVISGSAEVELSITASVFDESSPAWNSEDKTNIFKDCNSQDINFNDWVYFEATIYLNDEGVYDEDCQIEIDNLNYGYEFEFEIDE